MQSPLSRYILLVKRWLWLVLLGMGICCGATYLTSYFTHPVYQATATLIISLDTATSSNTTASLAAVPTYAQLLTNPVVLNPVVAQHKGMTLQQLQSMISVRPQSNTLLIELDVQNGNPQLATILANEVSKSFALYADSQLPGNVQILPAQKPGSPIKPKPLQDTGIAALVSLAIAVALIILFEWIDDRVSSPDEIRALLDTELLSIIPAFHKQKRSKKFELSLLLAEKYHKLCVSLNMAKTRSKCKMIVITSAVQQEGKSTIAANLACQLAITGKKVLLVDADLHHPTQERRFRLKSESGFAQVLQDMPASFNRELLAGQETEIPHLRVLIAGKTLPHAADLLQSPLVSSLFEYFQAIPCDYIIFDTPPVLPIADAQILASHVHGIIMVFDAYKTSRRALLNAHYEIVRTGTNLIGVVVNKSHWPDYENMLHYADNGTQPITEVQLTAIKKQLVTEQSETKAPFSTTPTVKLSPHGPQPLKLPSASRKTERLVPQSKTALTQRSENQGSVPKKSHLS